MPPPLETKENLLLGFDPYPPNMVRTFPAQPELVLLTQIVENMPISIVWENTAGNILYVNKYFSQKFGFTDSTQVIGQHWRKFVPPDELEKVRTYSQQRPLGRANEYKTKILNSEGKGIPVGISAMPYYDIEGKFAGTIAFLLDISELTDKNNQLELLNAKLAELARLDALTGLLNRRELDRLLPEEIARANRSHSPLSLMVVDLNDFKRINDAFGHPAGDLCLQHIACILQVVVRSTDSVFRFGGDEFTILLPETDAELVLHVASRLCETLSQNPFRLAEAESYSHLSIGISTYEPPSLNNMPHSSAVLAAHALLTQADSAMYVAKKNKSAQAQHADELNPNRRDLLGLIFQYYTTKPAL